MKKKRYFISILYYAAISMIAVFGFSICVMLVIEAVAPIFTDEHEISSSLSAPIKVLPAVSETEDIEENEGVVYEGVLFSADVVSEVGRYLSSVEEHSLGVLQKYGYDTAYVYDYCFDEEYKGYSIHIMFDDLRYQCVWVNPVNLSCIILYDCDLTNPVVRRAFY